MTNETNEILTTFLIRPSLPPPPYRVDGNSVLISAKVQARNGFYAQCTLISPMPCFCCRVIEWRNRREGEITPEGEYIKKRSGARAKLENARFLLSEYISMTHLHRGSTLSQVKCRDPFFFKSNRIVPATNERRHRSIEDSDMCPLTLP